MRRVYINFQTWYILDKSCHFENKMQKNLHISKKSSNFAAESCKEYDMSKYEIPFLTSAIQAFAMKFAMTRQAAFRYLQQYKALAFLMEFYDVEHLQSMDETIDDMLVICRQNGGTLA